MSRPPTRPKIRTWRFMTAREKVYPRKVSCPFGAVCRKGEYHKSLHHCWIAFAVALAFLSVIPEGNLLLPDKAAKNCASVLQNKKATNRQPLLWIFAFY